MTSNIGTGINPFIQGPIATNTNVNVSCIQSSIHVEEDTVTSNPILPIRVLRILGCIQIAIGAMCILISCIGIVLDAVDMTRNCNQGAMYNGYSGRHDSTEWGCWMWRRFTESLFAFDITCLICSGWFILTGFIPNFMSRERIHSWRCLKFAYMVCSIIGATLFVPCVFGLGVVGAIYRKFHSGNVVLLSAFLSVLAIAQIAVAIISASYCCCCTHWSDQTGHSLVYLNDNPVNVIMQSPKNNITSNFIATSQSVEQQQNPRVQQYKVIEESSVKRCDLACKEGIQ